LHAVGTSETRSARLGDLWKKMGHLAVALSAAPRRSNSIIIAILPAISTLERDRNDHHDPNDPPDRFYLAAFMLTMRLILKHDVPQPLGIVPRYLVSLRASAVPHGLPGA